MMMNTSCSVFAYKADHHHHHRKHLKKNRYNDYHNDECNENEEKEKRKIFCIIKWSTRILKVFFYVVFCLYEKTKNFFYPEKNHHINEKKNFIYNQSINDGHLSNVTYFEI